MRASTAYFVGAGTIIAAIAIGLGGGIVAGNIMNPVTPKGPDTSKVAQRAEAAAAATADAPSERVRYLTGSQAFGGMIGAPARAEVASEPAKTDTQPTQANAEPQEQPPSQAAAVEPPKEPSEPAGASSSRAVKSLDRAASADPTSSDAFAKASDADVKRAAAERRRMELRERRAERRRHVHPSPEQRGMRDRTDWDDVARNIRRDSEAHDYAGRPRDGFPQIRLFGLDDD